jgi:hypothetical protein
LFSIPSSPPLARNFLAPHACVLDQRERHIVEHGHRVEQRPRLEQHPEFLAHLVQSAIAQLGNVNAVDHDSARVGAQQQVQMLEQHGLAASTGAHDGRNAATQEIKIDAAQDLLRAEAMAQLAHLDRHRPLSVVLNNRHLRPTTFPSKLSRIADSIGESR